MSKVKYFREQLSNSVMVWYVLFGDVMHIKFKIPITVLVVNYGISNTIVLEVP